MGLQGHTSLERLYAHGRVNGFRALHGNGGGGQSGPGSAVQIGALQISPGNSGHKCVPAAGGVDHVRRETGQMDSAVVVGGKDAIAAERDEYAPQAGIQKSIGGAVQAGFVGNGDPGEQFCLYAVGFQRMKPAQNGLELDCLRRRDRVGKK